MSVSEQHERLVSHLIQWVSENHGTEGDLCILADHVSWKGALRPDPIGGFVPDIHAKGVGRAITIVGEAETDQGLQAMHTREQLEAFVDFLMFQPNPILALAVPWPSVRSASGIIKRILRDKGNPEIKVCILEGLE